MTKMNKGMKDHKKALKEKAVAKRAAAAEKSKQSKMAKVDKKTVKVPDVSQTIDDVAIEESHTSEEDVGSVAEDVCTSITNGEPPALPVTVRHGEPEGTSAEDTAVVDAIDSPADCLPAYRQHAL